MTHKPVAVSLEQGFWITSDLHLGHRKVANMRGFDTAPDHDKAIMGNIMNTVAYGDTLIILGDITLGRDLQALNMLKKLKRELDLTLILAPGNHDLCHPINKGKSITWFVEYSKVFDVIMQNIVLSWKGVVLHMTHYPVWGSEAINIDHENLKGKKWCPEPPHNQAAIIHGHTHSATKIAPQHVNVALEAHKLHPIHSSQLTSYVAQAMNMPKKKK